MAGLGTLWRPPTGARAPDSGNCVVDVNIKSHRPLKLLK